MSVDQQPGAEIRIRRARLRDWWRVYHAVRASFSDEYVDPFELLVALLTPWISLLVAEDGGHVVGTTMVIPNFLSSIAWIATVGVIPAYRRRGVARALMQRAEQVAERPRLRLEVYVDNPHAIDLYTSLGYRELRRQRGEGRPRMEMEKVVI